MKNELQLVKNFTYAGSNDRQTYNYICLYIVYGVQCDRCGSIFTEWYRLEIHRQVHDRMSKIKSMVHQNSMTIDYGITNRVDSSNIIFLSLHYA